MPHDPQEHTDTSQREATDADIAVPSVNDDDYEVTDVVSLAPDGSHLSAGYPEPADPHTESLSTMVSEETFPVPMMPEPRQPSHDAPEGLPEDRFLDRELSWLAFNERVLELAEDESTPLLERARFLAIFASNLDEFFMVRVAGLKRRIAAGFAVPSATGLSPTRLVELLTENAHELMNRHADVFHDRVRPALADEGITLVRHEDLEEAEQRRLRKLFRSDIFPVLTPLAVDPAHPFPTSPACPSTSRWRSRTPTTARSTSLASRCPRRCPGSSAWTPRARPLR